MNASTMWMALIAVGAILVAFGNIKTNLALEREKGEAAAQKALSMLVAECNRNLDRIPLMRQVVENNKILIQGLEATAWNVVSSGGLLVQVEQKTLEEITEVYYLVERAGKYQSEILDMSAGVRSALAGVGETRTQYMELLHETLNLLEPKLKSIVERRAANQVEGVRGASLW